MLDATKIRDMGTSPERWTAGFLYETDLSNAGPDFVATVRTWFGAALEAGVNEGERTAKEIEERKKIRGVNVTVKHTHKANEACSINCPGNAYREVGQPTLHLYVTGDEK